MLAFLTMDDFDFENKTAIIRVDFNSPLDRTTKMITDDTRIQRHAATIKELIAMGAKVVILAHQGRKGNPDFSSLENHASMLSEILGQKVAFVNDIFLERAQRAIKQLDAGDALVLDNVRGFTAETAKLSAEEHAQSDLVTNLSPLADVFVMDGFAVAHRSQASIVGFSKVLPCVAGRVMERELKALGRVRRAEDTPCVYVLGGAKADDAAAVCEYVLGQKTADYVLTGGVIGHLFLHAKGVDIGTPNVEYLTTKKFMQYVPQIMQSLKKYPEQIVTPIDYGIDQDGKRSNISLNDLPTAYPIFDIGVETIKAYRPYLEQARTIVISGPMGVYEREDFTIGTRGIFKLIADSDAFSVAGGGNTIEALERLGLSQKISYISTGGGALMEYLTGKQLPGVNILTAK
ncbi:MAG: phosphoglycerate kinase [Candidatus Bathyarchaeota archaeon]|nr:phosphoglycerate kinase [Candidatus Bathyarchaeota archaeon]